MSITSEVEEFCQICDSELSFEELDETAEDYNDTIKECFNLNFGSYKDGFYLCESCVEDLRDAIAFREKIKMAISRKYKLFSLNKTPVKTDQRDSPDSNSEEKIVLGDVTIKKIKSQSDECPDDENILIIVVDEQNKEPILIETAKDKLNDEENDMFIRPLTDDVRNMLLNSIQSNREEKLNIFKRNVSDVTIKKPKRNSKLLDDDDDESNLRVINKFIPLKKNQTVCPICCETFETSMQLFPHYKRHFNKSLCFKCGITCTSRSELSEHLKSHDSNRSLIRPLCPKQNKTQNLVAHNVNQHHKNVQPYNCNICKLRFNNMVTRRRHDYEVHGVEAFNYTCSICDKIFFRTPDLERHMKVVHFGHKDFSCLLCDKSFTSSRNLQDHMYSHTGTKEYQCDKCEKNFSRLSSLREHMKIHDNIKQYKCDTCYRRFTQKIALKKHMNTHS